MLENGASDSVAALVPETNETKDMESEVYHPDQGGRIREIAMDNTDLMPRVIVLDSISVFCKFNIL